MCGLDRAFEAVGFSNGGATERLAEVDALIAPRVRWRMGYVTPPQSSTAAWARWGDGGA